MLTHTHTHTHTHMKPEIFSHTVTRNTLAHSLHETSIRYESQIDDTLGSVQTKLGRQGSALASSAVSRIRQGSIELLSKGQTAVMEQERGSVHH